MDTRYYPSTLNDKMAASIGDLLSDGKRGLFMHYPLPKKGKYLALGFGDGDILWQTKDWDKSEASKWFGLIAEVFGNPKDFCTLRSRYGKHGDKLSYYRSMIGKEFEVVLP